MPSNTLHSPILLTLPLQSPCDSFNPSHPIPSHPIVIIRYIWSCPPLYCTDAKSWWRGCYSPVKSTTAVPVKSRGSPVKNIPCQPRKFCHLLQHHIYWTLPRKVVFFGSGLRWGWIVWIVMPAVHGPPFWRYAFRLPIISSRWGVYYWRERERGYQTVK